ncbi:glycosyltransferase family 1 protein [uncultured Bacteroides sp.]|uniref:glycosyltransferase family 4 protein n=1 Tax=uncultured Bacteroides sp. TaxID=162156 RepID=UPI0025EE7208|nr:glycosyltransferase family 1 protein [uncultured Bacteroides sp.]
MEKQPYIIYDSQIFDLQKYGGISRYFCEIISKLDMEYDISVRFTENHYLVQTKLAGHRIYVPHFFFKHYKQRLLLENQKLTRKLLRKSSPYLFHPTYYSPSFFECIGHNPYVITVHDMIHELFPEYFHDAKEVAAQKKEVITKADRIIAISENTKKDIINILNINPWKIDVIYHGTSMQPHHGKDQLSLPDRYILFVGDRTLYKNFQRLLEAFAIIHKTDQNLYLLCTGHPFNWEEKTLIDKLNIADRIIQISIDDRYLSELYSRALLFVFPSLYEGFGIPILEAYACHCPVALSNTSCFPEIAGDAGAYFDPYSVESIVQTLTEVIYSNKKRSCLVATGVKRLQLYSWEKATQETKKVYQKVLNEALIPKTFAK